MAHKIWTAQELETMTPAEQDELFNASIVRNLDDAPKTSSRASVNAFSPTSPTRTPRLGDRQQTRRPGGHSILHRPRPTAPRRTRSQRRTSTNDFQVLDLLRIVEEFATRWDDLPELIPGRTHHRILLAIGNVVARFASSASSPQTAPSSSSSSTSTARAARIA